MITRNDLKNVILEFRTQYCMGMITMRELCNNAFDAALEFNEEQKEEPEKVVIPNLAMYNQIEEDFNEEVYRFKLSLMDKYGKTYEYLLDSLLEDGEIFPSWRNEKKC